MNEMSKEELVALAKQLDELENRYTYRKVDFYYRDTGEFSRDKYPKQMAWVAAGKEFDTRALIGANGSGKTLTVGWEVEHHLTGHYPEDWQGRKFNRPIKIWISGINIKQLRSGVQLLLFGSYTNIGTGLIPKKEIINDAGVPQVWAMAGGVIGNARVRHYTNGVADGWSEIFFLTAEQGWEAFQGFNADIMWLDEDHRERKLVGEAMARTRGAAGQEGMFIYTGVQVGGKTALYHTFFPDGRMTAGPKPEIGAYVTLLNIWNDAPHISEKWKLEQLERLKLTDPNSIVARMDGLAAAGSGRVFPFRDDQVIVSIPKLENWMPRAYGLDPGWNATAAVWGAKDPNTGVLTIYAEYQQGQVIDSLHAIAVKSRGDWIPGSIDPHGAKHRGRDGVDTISYFRNLGLNLVLGSGDKTTLISMTLSMFQSGTLKISEDCVGLLDDLRNLVYDDKDPNKVAEKQSDHRTDALLYLIAKFDLIALTPADTLKNLIDRKDRDTYNEYTNDDDTGY